MFLFACSDLSPKQLGGITYQTESSFCNTDSADYWLLDVKAATQSDSVFLNTLTIGKKLEIEKSLLDSTTSFYKLINKLCVGDSINMDLPTDSFYAAFGFSRPEYLVKHNELKVVIYVRDKLSRMLYQAHKQLFEEKSIAKYVSKFNWNAKLDTASGIYYEKLKRVDEAQKPFAIAKFKYLIKTINDNPIDFNKEGEPLIYDTTDYTTLKGIAFLAKKLRKGESGRAIVPSTSAYGPKGNQAVPGNMPIIIELECLEYVE